MHYSPVTETSVLPWQLKEEKERQNKVALGMGQQELKTESIRLDEIEPSVDVKLRPNKKPVQESLRC